MSVENLPLQYIWLMHLDVVVQYELPMSYFMQIKSTEPALLMEYELKVYECYINVGYNVVIMITLSYKALTKLLFLAVCYYC